MAGSAAGWPRWLLSGAAGPPVFTGVPGRESAARISALDRMARAGVLVGQERGPLRSGPASIVSGAWLSGAWSLRLGHACCLPTVKPNAPLSQHSGPRPGDRQERLESVWLQLPRCWALTLARPFLDSPVPLWLERPLSCSHCFFQEFTACLGFRKHLHRARLGSRGSGFHLPSWQARCHFPAWHSVG